MGPRASNTIENDGTPYYLHGDQLGSVLAVTNSSGQVVKRWGYTPYGQAVSHAWNGAIPDAPTPAIFAGAPEHGYVGQWGVMTDANGLLNMRARYYSPYLRRFLNEDPIGFEGGMNWFAYLRGDPVWYVDPSGRDPLNSAEKAAVVSAIDLIRASSNYTSTEYNRNYLQDAVRRLTTKLTSGIIVTVNLPEDKNAQTTRVNGVGLIGLNPGNVLPVARGASLTAADRSSLAAVLLHEDFHAQTMESGFITHVVWNGIGALWRGGYDATGEYQTLKEYYAYDVEWKMRDLFDAVAVQQQLQYNAQERQARANSTNASPPKSH